MRYRLLRSFRSSPSSSAVRFFYGVQVREDGLKRDTTRERKFARSVADYRLDVTGMATCEIALFSSTTRLLVNRRPGLFRGKSTFVAHKPLIFMKNKKMKNNKQMAHATKIVALP
jgi:hypothetical protein